MPEAFENCLRTKDHKVRTKTLPHGKYVRGCTTDGKTWHWGEVKTSKGSLMAGGKIMVILPLIIGFIIGYVLGIIIYFIYETYRMSGK